MIGRTNVGGGGTGGALTVKAPAGATVTVSKDGKSKTKVAGSDGIVVFKGLQSGAWTLSITDGEKTASKPVDIVADYAVNIGFTLMLFDNGYQCDDITGGWTAVSWRNNSNFNGQMPSLSIDGSMVASLYGAGNTFSGGIVSGKKVDVSDFSALNIKINRLKQDIKSNYGGGLSVYLMDTNNTSTFVEDHIVASGVIKMQNDTYDIYDLNVDAIDLSGISGSYYIYLELRFTPAAGVSGYMTADIAELSLKM